MNSIVIIIIFVLLDVKVAQPLAHFTFELVLIQILLSADLGLLAVIAQTVEDLPCELNRSESSNNSILVCAQYLIFLLDITLEFYPNSEDSSE